MIVPAARKARTLTTLLVTELVRDRMGQLASSPSILVFYAGRPSA